LLEAMSGHPAEALPLARQAEDIASANADASIRARNLAIVAVASGGALAEADPHAAAEALTRAIDFNTAHDLPFHLLEPLLLRSRCEERIGDPAAAMHDLERGMAILESHPPTMGGVFIGEGVLDAEHALFEDAIRLSLDRNENAAAFAFAERSRGETITLTELQRRLAGSSTAVLEIVALPDELVTFAIAENAAVVARRMRRSDSLPSLADESLSESGTTAAATLYDEVIRPVDVVLAQVREVVIVPDRRLESVPFAALFDTSLRRHLIDRFAVSIASSAGSLSREHVRAGAPSLAMITLPSGNAESVALPEAEQEAHDIAALYTRAESIPPDSATLAALRSAVAQADVVHISGHTERQSGGGEEALLVTGKPGHLERVSWMTVLAPSAIHADLIVLAACETLRAPASAATHTLSLGKAFSAAGVANIVGTLAPIGDRDARDLFGALHRHLVSGVRPAEALRAAQLEAIARDKTNGGSRAWSAVALLTRRIPAPSYRKGANTWAN
jgi:CHAT domain-containing protein